jgi:hypothetical protein
LRRALGLLARCVALACICFLIDADRLSLQVKNKQRSRPDSKVFVAELLPAQVARVACCCLLSAWAVVTDADNLDYFGLGPASRPSICLEIFKLLSPWKPYKTRQSPLGWINYAFGLLRDAYSTSRVKSPRCVHVHNHLYRMIVCSGRGHGPRGLEISSRRGCARNAATLYGAKAYRGDRVFFR